MLRGARTVVPLVVLSFVALLTVAVGDGVSPESWVAPAYERLVPETAAPAVASPAPLLVRSDGTARDEVPSMAPSPSPVAPRLAPSPIVQPTEAPAVPAAPAAMPVVVAPAPRTLAPAPTQTAAPITTCPVDWFCYPRVGISGPIVPYTDCAGGSDIGTSIRAFTCLSPHYLLGHAYTQFGKITQWRAGDVVSAYGKAFTVSGAVTARSCEPPPLPLAPLSMQTSLSPSGCGSVLIVQAY